MVTSRNVMSFTKRTPRSKNEGWRQILRGTTRPLTIVRSFQSLVLP